MLTLSIIDYICVCGAREVINIVVICRRGWDKPCRLVLDNMLRNLPVKNEILKNKLLAQSIWTLDYKFGQGLN
jgi:hypothetical protein